MNVYEAVAVLIAYARKREWIGEEDEIYVKNRLYHLLGIRSDAPAEATEDIPLCEILSVMLAYAEETGVIEKDSITVRDLFDTEIMGIVTPPPSCVCRTFSEKYEKDPVSATDWFYRLATDTNYIRADRIAKDVKWKTPSVYGDVDITVNLSKPEKDPRAIAAARSAPQSDYPKCALCHENVGFSGSLTQAARQTLRQIPLSMGGERWYFQYSPYVYYNEHCIALSEKHVPMKIDRMSFEKALDFVSAFPHYFIGQNADLPIVGGSILSHDHMQGGRYEFAMERAGIEIPVTFSDFPAVTAGIVKWPLSVIRLSSSDRNALVGLADRILHAWRGYSDPEAMILAESDGEPHNTITPIARMREGKYELDLVLRNNRTTEEHPLGLFHPHAEHHNIKKENIGLIEVMGLAVLPARLKGEMAKMEEAILNGTPFSSVPEIAKHEAWFGKFKDRYRFSPENVRDILKEEIGKTFIRVLEDAGVYKTTADGRKAFLKFIASV